MSFNSDQAKITKKDDALGFADSAEATAKSIFSGKYPDGFVIGVEGEWGSGKTTYINFIRESLKKQSPEFKIIEFKPWLHSSQENLIAAYFKFLRENAKDIFGDDSDIKKNLASVAESFTPLVGTLASFAGLGEVAKSGMGLISETLKETPTLESQYEIIQKKLKEAKKPFVMIIDDLDRLDKAEVKTMLKLVKSVGRLPYVTYILAYDRKYIESATSEEMPHFLEKIIQLTIPLPKPDGYKLRIMLGNELQDFLRPIPNNDTRWRTIIHETLPLYIKKPRDVALLANAINFKFSTAYIDKMLDRADLLALECLRLFDKKLWDWIKNNEKIVLLEDNYRFIQHQKDQFKQIVETSLSALQPLSTNQKDILSLLFSPLADALDCRIHEIKEDHYKTENRGGMALKPVYDAYFNQYLDENEISKTDIDLFLKSIDDREKTTQTLRDYINKKDRYEISRIANFLRKLSYRFVDDDSPEPHPMLLWSLCDIYDDITSLKEPSPFDSRSPSDEILYTFRILLKKIGKQKTSMLLHALCKDTKYTFVATYLLYWVGYFIDKNYGDKKNNNKIDLIDDKDWDTALEIIAPHIKDIFVTGDVSNFSSVVYAQFLAGLIFGDEEARTLFENLYQKSETYTIKSIKGHLKQVTSENTGETRYEYRDAKYPALFDYGSIAKEARKIDLEKQDEDTREAVNVFLDGVRNPLNRTPTD